jgi:hypothetical protein
MIKLFKKEKMTNLPLFKGFPKIARLTREVVVTEKLDGTNILFYIDEDRNLFIGSRRQWLSEHNENHGAWHWAMERKEELLTLGTGYHYGELIGKSIQRGYGLQEKRVYLFNTSRWIKDRTQQPMEKQEYCPSCCHVVPILYRGEFDTACIETTLLNLKQVGSIAAPGFMNPEGIVIFHSASGTYFKKTLENDEGKNEKVQN